MGSIAVVNMAETLKGLQISRVSAKHRGLFSFSGGTDIEHVPIPKRKLFSLPAPPLHQASVHTAKIFCVICMHGCITIPY